MDTLRTPAALASLIAVNLAPLAGILLLGWSPFLILVLYFVDTLFGLVVVMLLLMMHVTGNEHGRPLSGWKDWTKAAVGLVLLAAIFALPLSVPLWVIGGDELDLLVMRSGEGIGYGIMAQALASGIAVVRMHRELKAREDDDRVLAARALFLVARWMTMFVAMVTGFLALLGPMIGGFLLVAIYGGASIYFELFPKRAERFVRGSTAKPITYQADLDGPGPAAPTALVAPAPVLPDDDVEIASKPPSVPEGHRTRHRDRRRTK